MWAVLLLAIASPVGYIAFRRTFAAVRQKIYREQEMESARQLYFVLTPLEMKTG
ncbi:MAG TPA: hypothetical protein VMF59_07070 [Bacteroidota bacterium]|nr:hypothetical protein [Bacteroidota bacterium]